MVPGELLHANAGSARRGRQISTSSNFRLCLVPSLEAVFDSADCRCLERYVQTDAISHIEELRDMIASLARLAPKEKIAHLLLGLRERLNPERHTLNLPLSRGDIADLLGIRTETISRALLNLEKAKLIRRNGPRTVEILDPTGLKEMASG